MSGNMCGWVVGSRVLCADELEGWVAGVVEAAVGIGREATLTVRVRERKVELAAAKVEAFDEAELEAVDDMALLDNLTEASMLQCLRLRYGRDAIYTSIGGIVVAVNPYQRLEGLYTEAAMDRLCAADAATLESRGAATPHPFALAESAVRGLVRERRSQSLLISGESGAGKTETVKYALRYLSRRSARESAGSGAVSVDELVLRSSPVLEAFANAKTARNDNSSRFGKYIQVFADPLSGRVTSASITSYLLEKVRVVEQLAGERNYHAFYQLVKAEASPLAESEAGDPRQFSSLSAGGVVDVAGVDDVAAWGATSEALRALSLSEAEVGDVGACLAACLALSDASFAVVAISGQDDGSVMVEKRNDAVCAASLLEVDATLLSDALCSRSVSGVTVPNSAAAARGGRDAFCKTLYDRLFQWLVQKINEALLGDDAFQDATNNTPPPHKTSTSAQRPGITVTRQRSFSGADASPLFVGLLDIFGFECFVRNSLEQLLINFANETLQAHFNAVVFENEAREYAFEGVTVDAVTDFVDNSHVLRLLDKVVLRTLDEESALKSGNDKALLTKLERACASSDASSAFFAVRARRTSTEAERALVGVAFGVAHFAGCVAYCCDGFVAKNRDALPEAIGHVAAKSKRPLVASLFELEGKTSVATEKGGGARGKRTGNTASSSSKKRGVAKQFSASLAQLSALVDATTPSFVRCVKPNANAQQRMFDGAMVQEQLRYMGVLQIVEARKRGYGRRYERADFVQRFKALKSADAGDSAEQVATALRTTALRSLQASCVAVGKTKVFVKTEADALLEAARDATLRRDALGKLADPQHTVESLEQALTVAVVDLRLRGPEVDQAKRRLLELRLDRHFERVRCALRDADRGAGLAVPELSAMLCEAREALDSARAAVKQQQQLAGPNSPLDVALDSLSEQVDVLSRRCEAQAECGRCVAEAVDVARFSFEAAHACSDADDDALRAYADCARMLDSSLELHCELEQLMSDAPECLEARALRSQLALLAETRKGELRAAREEHRRCEQQRAEERSWEDARRCEEHRLEELANAAVQQAASSKGRARGASESKEGHVVDWEAASPSSERREQRAREEQTDDSDAAMAQRLAQQWASEDREPPASGAQRGLPPPPPRSSRQQPVPVPKPVLSPEEQACAARARRSLELARVATWLDPAEQRLAEQLFAKRLEKADCSYTAASVVELSQSERVALLQRGATVLKLASRGHKQAAEWKVLRLVTEDQSRLVWSTESEQGGAVKKLSAFSKLSLAVSAKKSDGQRGVPLASITRVTVGPVERCDLVGFVELYHATACVGKAMPTSYSYLTLTTAERDYVFGFAEQTRVELLLWAVSLERLCDACKAREQRCVTPRGFGEGVLARAQRRYADALALDDDDKGKKAMIAPNKAAAAAAAAAAAGKRSPFSSTARLAQLCPAVRPLALVLAATLERCPCHTLFTGAPEWLGAGFGAFAPRAFAESASWLACAVLDSPVAETSARVVVADDTLRAKFGFAKGEVACVASGLQPARHPALALAARHVRDDATLSLLASQLAQAVANGAGVTIAKPARSSGLLPQRASATRVLPDKPNFRDLFAACANGDADLVEALVLRRRVRVNDRYQSDEEEWERLAGADKSHMEPADGTTALCYVITWCDVLGDTLAERVVRRLLLLRADPALDDGHPEVRFPPLCAAVANGSTRIALTLLHAGAEPDARTSDGRAALHILSLAEDVTARQALLEALINAGADVNAVTSETGDSPLHVAARDGAFDVVLGLIGACANTILLNNSQCTPAELALIEYQTLEEDVFQDDTAENAGREKLENIRKCSELLS